MHVYLSRMSMQTGFLYDTCYLTITWRFVVLISSCVSNFQSLAFCAGYIPYLSPTGEHAEHS
jgi:hypothetical protein